MPLHGYDVSGIEYLKNLRLSLPTQHGHTNLADGTPHESRTEEIWKNKKLINPRVLGFEASFFLVTETQFTLANMHLKHKL